MRIAYFTDTYLPVVNGVSYSVDTFSKFLSQNHQIRIYAPSYSWKESVEKRGNLEIFRYTSFALLNYKDLHLPLPNVMKVIKNVEEFKPDLIHIHTPVSLGLTGILVSKLLKKPLVGTYHTLYSETLDYISVKRVIYKYLTAIELLAKGVGMQIALKEEKNANEGELSKKLAWQVVNKIYSFCDLVICPSNTIKIELLERRFKKTVCVVSNGVDTKIFSPLGQQFNNQVVLYVGRLGFEKNVDQILKAFSVVVEWIPKARLWIVGDGPAKRGLVDLARELRIERYIRWYGMVDRMRLPQIYTKGTVMVTASTMETQGLTVLEAMACGLPVVGVKSFALPDLIKNGKNGLLVDPGDINGMATAVVKILNNEKMAKVMGENSLKMSEAHSIDKSVEEVCGIYCQLFNDKV